MPRTPQRRDDEFVNAANAYQQAIANYQNARSVESLVALYEAQNAFRAVLARQTEDYYNNQPKINYEKEIGELRNPRETFVPGQGVADAEALLTHLKADASTGRATPKTGQYIRELESYIQAQTAQIQDNDSQFADSYMSMTGQPPPPGRFSSAQTINGTAPTPQPQPGLPAPEVGRVPDPGVRPERTAPLGAQLPNSPAYRPDKSGPPPKRKAGDREADAIYVEPLPEYAQYGVAQDYRTIGQDLAPGMDKVSTNVGEFDFERVAKDSVNNADQQIRQSPQYGLFQTGYAYGQNRDAVKSGSLVFTGWQTRSSKYIDENNPRFGSQIVNTRTPTYQSAAGMLYALGKPGYPTIAEFQKAMQLPVTGTLDDDTMNQWKGVINDAAMNTAALQPGMTVQQAMAQRIKRMEILAAQQRAAMAAAYNVDPTASAAVLGSATKQMIGRLSTPQEDSEFHRAFNSANISTQGKVDAQQFARDWVRNKHPTEAGTQMGQDYYGAMFDVLTAGPGTLGSEAADVSG